MQNNLFANIIQNLTDIFSQAFGVKDFHYQVRIDNADSSAPITLRSKKEIILNFNLNCKNELAFQLSHELCHAMIPRDAPSNLRWLEETFAVLSSFVFPLCLPDIVSSFYIGYFIQALARYDPLCTDLERLPDSSVYSFLASGSGTNNYNDYGSYWHVAQMLSSCVSEHPDIWKALPYLCDAIDKPSFEETLQSWEDITPLQIRNSVSVIKSSLLDI